jgi:hypothetical protein
VQIIHQHEYDIAHWARKRSKQEERMKRARARAIQCRSTQQLERTNPEDKSIAGRQLLTRANVMTHRRPEEILIKASTEIDDGSGNDYIPSMEECDDTSENFSSDSSADGGDDSINSDQVSEDSDSDDLPPGESLKVIPSKLWEVSELVNENDDDLFIVSDMAKFAEINHITRCLYRKDINGNDCSQIR